MIQTPTLAAPAIPAAPVPARGDLRGPVLAGLVALVLLVGVLGGWAATTVIAGAVVASGHAVVEGRPQAVQSLDGGIVAAIEVREGDRVRQGDLLMRLDPTLVATNLDIATTRLADALARRARLEAEQAGQATLVFDWPALPFPLPDTARHEAGQRQIFTARAELRAGQRDRLAETLAQIDAQIAGTTAQARARLTQLDLLRQEIDSQRKLSERGLAREAQLLDLLRSEAELIGQAAALETDAARLANSRRDRELETLQAERTFMEGVVTDLREATSEVEELMLDIVTRRAQLDRVEIRAPADGIVHAMQVATVGGVVAPGAELMQVVPVDRGIAFEARVDPRAIDQVHPGQRAQVMIGSFDPQTTPRLEGRVISVSPDAITDPATRATYYRVTLGVPEEERARLGGAALLPGMPIEAFLETGDRSVLAYLVQPMATHLRQAFRE